MLECASINIFRRCFTCCLFLAAQSTLATNLMHERMAPCTPPPPVLEEGVLQAEEHIVAATFPNSRGMRALLVEKSDEIRLVLVDSKNKLIRVKSEGRCHVNIGNAREIMWVDDDTVFTGFSGRIWSEYHVIQLSMDPNGAY